MFAKRFMPWWARHIHQQLKEITHAMSKLTDALADLQASVNEENTVIDSAIGLINGIPTVVSTAVQEALQAAGVDSQAALDAANAANAAVTAETAKLSEALRANTPAAPTP